MSRRRIGVPLAALAAAGALAVPALAAAPPSPSPSPKPIVQKDAAGDVSGKLDLRQVVLARGTDGRIRVSLTLASAWDGDDLLSDDGPPGSLCLKLWTASPANLDATPDHLVCVTAQADGDLRGSILKARANQLPARVGSATITRPSTRTVTIRFSQTAIGKPAAVELQAETTRAGCTRASCIDRSPEQGAALVLTLRKDKS
ncbi:MAG TPA: hypothetical protein VFG42_13085 [Baekduia sp.]|uniref:hypothetical protein n=1 Tax=Baekduia sp. TaxID=2600305 RepID=UPI002D7A0B3D|nr:hypothetical protein [Baekduia sp.]HET6507718.1 hypothetical protein [Baekduia sp.]